MAYFCRLEVLTDLQAPSKKKKRKGKIEKLKLKSIQDFENLFACRRRTFGAGGWKLVTNRKLLLNDTVSVSNRFCQNNETKVKINTTRQDRTRHISINWTG